MLKGPLKFGLFALLLSSSTIANAQEKVLRIANYGGLFTETTNRCTADLFTKRTGVKVIWIDGNPTDHVAKLATNAAGNAPFDVVYLDDSARAQGLAAGVLEKIDTAALTNLGELYDVAKKDSEFSPVVNFFSIGVAYNSKIFQEKGIAEPKTWADLWNPQLAGRIAIPDITTSAGQAMVTVAAWLSGGNERDVKQAFQKLAEIKPLYFFKSSADLQAKFASGDAWIAPWYNGRAWGMINSGFPMKFIYPDEKGFGLTTTVHLVKGTKNKAIATEYINTALDPLPQLCQAYYLPYGPTNKTLSAVMKAYPRVSEQFPSSQEELNKLYLADFTAINNAYPRWLDSWNRMVVK